MSSIMEFFVVVMSVGKVYYGPKHSPEFGSDSMLVNSSRNKDVMLESG
jgi:hypothetical protein